MYEADTFAGKCFDVCLIFMILLSTTAVMLDSIRSVRETWGGVLNGVDWFITIVFPLEYCLRIYAVNRPKNYMTSFYGLIDLVSVLPSYLSLIVPGAHYFSIIRIFRVLRIFRILKLAKYLAAADDLASALVASRQRITVFITGVVTLVVFIGSAMYVIEGEENGFTSIPVSIYWAVVTLTTVGYGDISPKTSLGQAFSVLIMILGYGIIAIPTGIVTAELAAGKRAEPTSQACPVCCAEGHDHDAIYCKYCASKLN
ncbi:MAG TPA: ion transporter [Candidatus Rifleibacterium sp.]|nr:ion transporter [Candidatus Rifleibacterium sp.]